MIPTLRIDQLRTSLPLSSTELREKLRSLDPIEIPRNLDIRRVQEDVSHDLRVYELLIHELRVRQATLRRDGAAYASLGSPVRRLPSEILRSIFAFASTWCTFGVKDLWDFQAKPHVLESAPFRLGSVCKRWREVAVGYPKLWSWIAVDLGKASLEALKLCIIRSQHNPLILFLVESEGYGNPALLRLLMEQGHRWQSIRFSNLSQATVDTLSNIELLSLEGIVVKGNNSEVLRPHIARSQKLRYLTLRHDISLEALALFPPLSKLRHLIVEHQSEDTLVRLIEFLGTCQSHLTTLEYAGPCDVMAEMVDRSCHAPFAVDLPHITLEALCCLSVDIWDDFGSYGLLKDLFGTITVPLLAELDIQLDCSTTTEKSDNRPGFEGVWPRDVVRSFMIRSQCSLTKLSLSGMPLSDVDVVAFLRMTPNLVYLRLEELWTPQDDGAEQSDLPFVQTVTKSLLGQFHGSLFDSTTYGYHKHALLPKLRSLYLKVQSHFDADTAFVEMVKSRWNVLGQADPNRGERLRAVELKVLGRTLDCDIYESLSSVEGDGMRIVVIGDKERII